MRSHFLRPNLPTVEQQAADVARRRAQLDAKREKEDYFYYQEGFKDGLAAREPQNKGAIIMPNDADFPAESDDAKLQSLRRELAAVGIDLSVAQVRTLQRIVISKERAVIMKARQEFPSIRW